MSSTRGATRGRKTPGVLFFRENIAWHLSMSTSGDPDMPFRFKRRQFPVRQAFAITINKSQGQSLERVGVWLKQAVFAHGQLYVALSRCGSRGGVRIALCPSAVLRTDASGAYVTNVVYYEVLGLPPPGTAMLCDVSEVDDADLAAAGDVIEAMMAAGGGAALRATPSSWQMQQPWLRASKQLPPLGWRRHRRLR
jgi:hypothetical protein